MRQAFPLVILAALAACGGRPLRGEEGAPKAVVLSTAGQDAVSQRIARALNDEGYDVVRKSTPIVRPRSTMSVYDARKQPERIVELTRLMRQELGVEIEVLPFQQHATGGNAVVIWLGEDDEGEYEDEEE